MNFCVLEILKSLLFYNFFIKLNKLVRNFRNKTIFEMIKKLQKQGFFWIGVKFDPAVAGCQKLYKQVNREKTSMAEMPRYLPKPCTKIFDIGKLLKFCGETVQVS